METRVAELRRRADRLWERLQSGLPLSGAELEALVEASFRLGVHQDTAPAEALGLLWRAHRLDIDNPKHAYHLGRLYLAHGRLDQAAIWLAKAAQLAPTSHRIWAHISIAERALDARRQGEKGYTGDHLARAKAIAQAVREGSDELDPSQPGVGRLQDAGRCRWSGINDVEVEIRLRENTTELTRDALSAELELLADLAGRRRGGAAAFTVLAVQWIVYGYPPATVRKLAAPVPEGPALDLLLRVCDLAETPAEHLAGALAAALSAGELPELAVALLHQRHLLRRPLRFPDLGARAAAAAFTPNSGGDADRLVRALEAAVSKLTADPPQPMGEAVQEVAAAEVTDPQEQLTKVRALADQLVATQREAQSTLIRLAKTPGVSSADVRALTSIVDLLPLAAAAGRELLGELSGTPQERVQRPIDDFYRDVQTCESTLRELATKGQSKMRTNLGKIAAASVDGPEAASPALAALLDPLLGYAPTEVEEAPVRELPAPLEPGDWAPDRVARALQRAQLALHGNTEDARASLAVYPPAVLASGPMAALRDYVEGHRAEASYRLDDTAAARAQWHTMLRHDPLNLATLANLAVAQTSAGDLVQAAGAWQHYLDAHYVLDLAAGSPRGNAAARADLHQVLTTAFGTSALRRPASMDDGVGRELSALVASRGRTAIATEHLRLEVLNRVMAQRNPLLLLGVARNANGEALAAARERTLAMVADACALLPARIGPAFARLCAAAVDSAHAEAPAAQRRARTAADEQAEAEHLAWLKEVILLKVAIRNALLTRESQWPLTGYAGDVIGNLRLLDAVTLDPADESVRQAAQHLDPRHDPQAFLKRHNDLAGEACHAAAISLQEHLSGAADDEGLPGRFAGIGASWARNAVPEEFMHVIDDPVGAYRPSGASAMKIVEGARGPLDEAERATVEAAVPAMRRWIDRLPGATGPARDLARMLSALDRRGEARTLLKQAKESAFSAYGRDEAEFALAELAIDDGRCRDAVEALRTLTTRRPDDRRLPVLFFNAYQEWIRTEPGTPKPAAIIADLSRWSDDRTVGYRRMLCANAVLAAHERNPDLVVLLHRLRELRADDPDNLHALYHEVHVLHAQALEERGRMRGLSGQARKAAGELATAKIAECAESGRAYVSKAEPGEMRSKVEAVLSQLGR